MLHYLNDIARARLMGNALIVGVVACIATAMLEKAPSNPVELTAAASMMQPVNAKRGVPRAKIVHAVAGTRHITDGVSTGNWTFSLNLHADLTCSLRFDARLLGHFMPMLLYPFESIADLRDTVGTRLGSTHIPPPLLSALFAAVPKFIVDAARVFPAGEHPSKPTCVTLAAAN